jgi:hypothetical protein
MSERIDKYRKSQSVEELKRKRDKAWRRQGLWTQEDIDYAEVSAREILKKFGFYPFAN